MPNVSNQNHTPLWIQKTNWNNLYKLAEIMPDKALNIDAFLIHSVSPKTNSFRFSNAGLARRFQCSVSTVKRAISALKKDDAVLVTKHHVHYRHYVPFNKKGDVTND